MAANDYAIVVGINTYPGFSSLKGPENDAQAVRDWLVQAEAAGGGGVPAPQVTLILSSDYAANADASADPLAAKPMLSDIDLAFDRLIDAGLAQGRLGRRLTIYLAGHGFGPDLEEAALLMANASRRRLYHLPGRRYARWFRTAAMFDEIVLVMDCCRDNYPTAPLHVPAWPEVHSAGAGEVAYFYAFATKWSAKARERPVSPGGPVRGLFTRALLEALSQAEADDQGRVTGSVIKRYVNQQLALWQEDEKKPQQPRFEFDDQAEIVFVQRGPRRGAGPPATPVRLTLPAAPAELLDGQFQRLAQTGTAGLWHLTLPAGLYLLQLPEAGQRQVIEVFGASRLEIEPELETGSIIPASLPAGPLVRLTVESDSPGAEIVLLDGRLNQISQGLELLATKAPPGLYKLTFRAGDGGQTLYQVIEPNSEPLVISGPALAFSSAAPLDRTRTSRETHQAPAANLSRQVHERLGQGSQLFIFSRDLAPDSPANTAARLTLHSAAGDELLDLAQTGPRDLIGQWAACNVELEPGHYRLRLRLSADEVIEESLIASPDWQTQVFLLRRAVGEQRQVDLGSAAILMARPGQGFEPHRPDLRLTDLARQALAEGRPGLAPDLLNRSLWEQNPLLGLLAGHLLRLEPNPDRRRLADLVNHLTPLLGDHPDLAALSLPLLEAGLRDIVPAFSLPPMLRRGWQMVVAASAGRPGLVPAGSLSARIADRAWGDSAWLVWAKPDEEVITTKGGFDQAAWNQALRDLLATVTEREQVDQILAASDLSPVEAGLLTYLYRVNRLNPPDVTQSLFGPAAELPSPAELARAFALPPSVLPPALTGLSAQVERLVESGVITRGSFQLGGDRSVIGSSAGEEIIVGDDNVIIGGVRLARRRASDAGHPPRVETQDTTQIGSERSVIGSSAGGSIITGSGNVIRRQASSGSDASAAEIKAELSDLDQTMARLRQHLSGPALDAALQPLLEKRADLATRLPGQTGGVETQGSFQRGGDRNELEAGDDEAEAGG
jgi:hypothetical protein